SGGSCECHTSLSGGTGQGHGERRVTDQAVSCLSQRKRSCRRNAPSAQNSIWTGVMRKPPQKGGRRGLVPWITPCFAAAAANAARLSSGRDCFEAHAPSLLCRARLA